MKQAFFSRLASLVAAIANCEASGNREWLDRHTDRLEALVREHCPRGSGFDNGTKLDMERTTREKLVFSTAFHHMDENGYYDGWTDHTVTVTASLWAGITIRVSGRNRNNVKEHISEAFHYLYSVEITD